MGYTTEFTGQFTLNKPLDEDTYKFLHGLAGTRRMKRDLTKIMPANLAAQYGIEGEFFFGGVGFMGQDEDESIVDRNSPPSTQPSLWCQWVPTQDHLHIQWDEGEKFYEYIPWIQYIIDKILKPKGYALYGSVSWQGEDDDDKGWINIDDNEVNVGTYPKAIKVPEWNPEPPKPKFIVRPKRQINWQ